MFPELYGPLGHPSLFELNGKLAHNVKHPAQVFVDQEMVCAGFQHPNTVFLKVEAARQLKSRNRKNRRGADPLHKFRPAGPPSWGAEWLAPEPVRRSVSADVAHHRPHAPFLLLEVLNLGLDRSLVPKPENVEDPAKMRVRHANTSPHIGGFALWPAS